MRKLFLSILLASFIFYTQAQNNSTTQNQRLKVFIDCINARCDMNFIRTEINICDFLLDPLAADVHVLITRQQTGGGGNQYQLIFFGQNRFKQMMDTIRFNTDANATNFEERDMMLKFLKLGLTPYLVKTNAGNDIVIGMKKTDTEKEQDEKNGIKTTKDPWNYWVYRVGVSGHYRADENYKISNLYAEVSANRVTEELKTGFELSAGKNKEIIFGDVDTLGNRSKTINRKDEYSFQHFLVKSISEHWSYGYEVVFSRSTFSNNKRRALVHTGIEYAIFPYKQVNTKFFTVSYTIDVRRNSYFDSTLYDKTKETLFGHGIESNLSFKQKWGSIFFGLEYHNYLHNWKYFLLGANLEMEIRITGGLTLNIFSNAELTRDQLYLPKEGASFVDILTRRRQLASGYSFLTGFGLTYRFGSKLNNFVNPRFD